MQLHVLYQVALEKYTRLTTIYPANAITKKGGVLLDLVYRLRQQLFTDVVVFEIHGMGRGI